MTRSTHPLRVLSFVLAVTWASACTTDDPTDDEATGDGDQTGDGDGDGDQTGDGDGEATGDGDGDQTGDGDGDGDQTGDGDGDTPCDPWLLMCETVDTDPPVTDCGIVDQEDDLLAWQTARDCALDAVAMTASFKVMGQAYGIDSLLSNAYGAVAGFVYAPMWIYHDTWGIGAEGHTCADIIATANCTVTVGDLCLECVEPGAPTQLCL